MLMELAVEDRFTLADNKPVVDALATQLAAKNLDGGGPRLEKPKQIVECVVAALGLAIIEDPDRRVSLGDDVRREVTAALAAIADVELAVPAIREMIIAEARARCADGFHPALMKVNAQLDDRGQQIIKLPKVPIDALHAVQRALADARAAISERVAGAALERAVAVIARADAGAAARIDQPITWKATPRELAILRACEPRAGDTPAKLVHSLLESLTELVPIAWRAPEQQAKAYGASKTFAVGDIIDHPKFGRGTVVSSLAQRIEVEFPDGKHTLVHVPPRR
jgi:hypothetical protein